MEENKLLLELASKSIESEFDSSIAFDKKKLLNENPILNEVRACFITLTLNGKLRGCIGSLLAHRTLLEDILHNAKSAAFADLRFDRLTKKEFEKIKIEISILSVPSALEYSDFNDLEKKIVPNVHGVILELNGKKATFLPQVWEQLPTFNEFMVHLCKKAGLEPNKLPGLPKIHTYEARKIK